MKIKVGIVGYGNLGKSVENDIIFNKKFKLIAIFSKRNIISNFGTKIENTQNIKNYIGKIDVLFLCGGSKNDIEKVVFELAKNFNTINCFDTHKNIYNISKKLNEICKMNKRISIMSTGWDPGIFSLMRTLFYSLGDQSPVTFWGKGISMGHSDAARQVENVKDAVQFTIPNKEALKFYKVNKVPSPIIPKHKRLCYVCADKNFESKISNTIANMPNYFKGQPTIIRFVSANKIKKLKENLSHKGTVLSNVVLPNNESCFLQFNLKITSNAAFTARIMMVYCNAILNLKKENNFGCHSVIDIPLSKLFSKEQLKQINKKLV